jgi:hypothetical protein
VTEWRLVPNISPRPGRLLPLAVAATLTVIAAVAMDILADEPPSHTAALGLVAVVVAALRLKLTGRYEGVLSAVSGALVAQPALHATSKIGGPVGPDNHGGLLHVVTSEGPVTATQVVVPALIVIAVASCARFVELILGALSRPLRLLRSPPFEAPRRVLITVRAVRRGSMLHWCGWAINAARRGPPAVTTSSVARTA